MPAKTFVDAFGYLGSWRRTFAGILGLLPYAMSLGNRRIHIKYALLSSAYDSQRMHTLSLSGYKILRLFSFVFVRGVDVRGIRIGGAHLVSSLHLYKSFVSFALRSKEKHGKRTW